MWAGGLAILRFTLCKNILCCDTTQVFGYFYFLFLKPGHWFRHDFLYFWKNFIVEEQTSMVTMCIIEYNFFLAGRQNRITRTRFASLFLNVVFTKAMTLFWLVIFVCV